MNDKEFVIEFVKRLPKTPTSKTLWDMIRIVEDKKAKPVEDLWRDIDLIKLYGEGNIIAETYKFIRDNQELFVDNGAET